MKRLTRREVEQQQQGREWGRGGPVGGQREGWLLGRWDIKQERECVEGQQEEGSTQASWWTLQTTGGWISFNVLQPFAQHKPIEFSLWQSKLDFTVGSVMPAKIKTCEVFCFERVSLLLQSKLQVCLFGGSFPVTGSGRQGFSVSRVWRHLDLLCNTHLECWFSVYYALKA